MLMSADRLDATDLVITQEMLASLLGVRRESVTQTLGLLQKDGLIGLRRGHVILVDRPKLEQRVCECYAAVKAEYERLLPTGRSAK